MQPYITGWLQNHHAYLAAVSCCCNCIASGISRCRASAIADRQPDTAPRTACCSAARRCGSAAAPSGTSTSVSRRPAAHAHTTHAHMHTHRLTAVLPATKEPVHACLLCWQHVDPSTTALAHAVFSAHAYCWCGSTESGALCDASCGRSLQ